MFLLLFGFVRFIRFIRFNMVYTKPHHIVYFGSVWHGYWTCLNLISPFLQKKEKKRITGSPLSIFQPMICVWQSERCICLRRLSFNIVVLSMDLLHVAPDDLDHRCRSLLWLIPSSTDFVFYPSNGSLFPVSSFLSPLLVIFWFSQVSFPFKSCFSRWDWPWFLDRLAPCLFSRDWFLIVQVVPYWYCLFRMIDHGPWFLFLQLFSLFWCLEAISSWFKLSVLIHYWRSLLSLWYLVSLSRSCLE